MPERMQDQKLTTEARALELEMVAVSILHWAEHPRFAETLRAGDPVAAMQTAVEGLLGQIETRRAAILAT